MHDSAYGATLYAARKPRTGKRVVDRTQLQVPAGIGLQTMLTIAADPKHLGARIGITAVLHTWGSAMTHHPHIHMIVPGGGIIPDGRWISSRPACLLPVRVHGALCKNLIDIRATRIVNTH